MKFLRCAAVSLAKGLHKLSGGRLTPNAVTAAGLLLHLPIAWLIVLGELAHAGIGLLLVGSLDAIDGSLARLQGRETAFGAWFDATSDRLKETIVLGALAYYLAANDAEASLIALCAAVLGISISISYFKAKAEAVLARKRSLKTAKPLKGGLLSYEWRVVILSVALLSQQFLVGLGVMAGLGLITLCQRGLLFQRQLKGKR